MHRKPVLAANWKLNHTPTDARAFLQRFLALSPRQQDRTVILFPSAITVTTVTDALRDRPDIWVGVQNVHSEAQGAFTGENSVLMLITADAVLVDIAMAIVVALSMNDAASRAAGVAQGPHAWQLVRFSRCSI